MPCEPVRPSFALIAVTSLIGLNVFLRKNFTRGNLSSRKAFFSMDGDIADLKALVELKKRYEAILIVDEAHALGCMGQTGAGLCEREGVLDDVDIIVAPLGKAVAAAGGIVAGPQPVIDYLVNKSRPFIFTTAPSPAVAAGAVKAIGHYSLRASAQRTSPDRSRNPPRRFPAMGLDIGNSTTHIIPVILGEAERAVVVSKALYDAGYYVAAIRPPTVPPHTARLRISVQADHTSGQLDGLCEALIKALKT
jgi:7-keto-8-aminopelargonate synthetase-like enzyme